MVEEESYQIAKSITKLICFFLQEWSGPFKPVQDEKWPCARGLHAAACLVDPESKIAEEEQYVIVVWGQGVDAKHVPDIWILHVQSMKWKEVSYTVYIYTVDNVNLTMFYFSIVYCSFHSETKNVPHVLQ